MSKAAQAQSDFRASLYRVNDATKGGSPDVDDDNDDDEVR